MRPFLAYLADVLLGVGLITLTVAVIGVIRLPDLYLRLHAAAKAPVLGVAVILVASIGTRDAAIIARSLLIAVLLSITAVASAHAIGWAEYKRSTGAGRGGEGGDGVKSSTRQQS